MDLWLYRLSKVPDWIVWILTTAFLGVLLQLTVGWNLWVALTYVPPFLLVEALSRSPRAIGFLSARKDAFARGAIVVFALIPLILLFTTSINKLAALIGSLRGSPGDVPEAVIASSAGLLLGITLRRDISKLVYATLTDHRRLLLSIMFMIYWTLGAIFYLWSLNNGLTGWYVLSVFGGLAIQRGIRLNLSKKVSGFKRLRELRRSIPNKLKQVEWEALELLAKGRQFWRRDFRRVRRHIEKVEISGLRTRNLALMKASIYRLEGQFQASIEAAEEADIKVPSLVDAHLILLRAINLAEQGRDDEAQATLAGLLPTKKGKKCPLAKGFSALRSAEIDLDRQVPMIGEGRFEGNAVPLVRVLSSFRMRSAILRARSRSLSSDSEEERVELYMGRFAELAIPVTPLFFLDILGLVKLAAGFPEEGRLLLERCVQFDRSFSNAYLHLGYYFLFRNSIIRGRPPRKTDLWHAEACFHAAYFVERNEGSRIRRRAMELIREIGKIEASEAE